MVGAVRKRDEISGVPGGISISVAGFVSIVMTLNFHDHWSLSPRFIGERSEPWSEPGDTALKKV